MIDPQIKVELLDHMGSDLSVVNAARVSFDKVSTELADGDKKLIKYLADHNHWSPFAHCFAQFRIKAPIFVARQLVKHQVGLAWNEVSRRYVSSPPDIWYPDDGQWRLKHENKKQGSSDETISDEVLPFMPVDKAFSSGWKDVEVNEVPKIGAFDLIRLCTAYYNHMIENGVCPEMARSILPQGAMTEWIWSGSLFAFARVCNLRLDPHAQKETREVALHISSALENLYPTSWKYLCDFSKEHEDYGN